MVAPISNWHPQPVLSAIWNNLGVPFSLALGAQKLSALRDGDLWVGSERGMASLTFVAGALTPAWRETLGRLTAGKRRNFVGKRLAMFLAFK